MKLQKKLINNETKLKQEREASRIYQLKIIELNKTIEDLKLKQRIEIEAVRAEADLSPDVVVEEISEADDDEECPQTTKS